MAGALVQLILHGVHGVRQPAKSVLIVLGETCKEPRSLAYPGVPRIAAILNMGEKSVREALEDLQAIGWITKVPGTGKGPGNPAKFIIDFNAMIAPAREFRRSKGEVCLVGKAVRVHRNDDAGKAVRVHRNWSEEKRRKLQSKAVESNAQSGGSGPAKRYTGANETYGNVKEKANVADAEARPQEQPETQPGAIGTEGGEAHPDQTFEEKRAWSLQRLQALQTAQQTPSAGK